MSSILALLMVLILILTGGLRARKKHLPVFAPRYLHPGHTWMQMTNEGEVLVGIDDFVATLLSRVDSVKLPRVLQKVAQGGHAVELTFGSRKLRLVSPVSGRVIETNEMVLMNPSLVLSSPLHDGWLFKVHPRNAGSQIHNLFTGTWSAYWEEVTRTHLTRLFAGTPVLTAHDGGMVMKGTAERCSDAEWSSLAREFFPDASVRFNGEKEERNHRQ